MARWQKLLLVYCILQLLWAVAGLIANPDFSLGADATSVRVLGVDFNGWHALSGLLLFVPGLYAVRRDQIAVPFVWAAIAGLMTTAIWAFFSERPAWVFYFPHPTADVVLHIGSSVILGLLLVVRQRDRAVVPAG